MSVWDLWRCIWQNVWVCVLERMCVCQCVFESVRVRWCVYMCINVWGCLWMWMSIYKCVSVRACVCECISGSEFSPGPYIALSYFKLTESKICHCFPKFAPPPLISISGKEPPAIPLHKPKIWESCSSPSSNQFPLSYIYYKLTTPNFYHKKISSLTDNHFIHSIKNSGMFAV